VCLYFFTQKVHYRVHKLVSKNIIFSHFIPILIYTLYLPEIIFNKYFTITNRWTYLLVLESTKIYIKIYTEILLRVSVYGHHQGALV